MRIALFEARADVDAEDLILLSLHNARTRTQGQIYGFVLRRSKRNIVPSYQSVVAHRVWAHADFTAKAEKQKRRYGLMLVVSRRCSSRLRMYCKPSCENPIDLHLEILPLSPFAKPQISSRLSQSRFTWIDLSASNRISAAELSAWNQTPMQIGGGNLAVADREKVYANTGVRLASISRHDSRSPSIDLT